MAVMSIAEDAQVLSADGGGASGKFEVALFAGMGNAEANQEVNYVKNRQKFFNGEA